MLDIQPKSLKIISGDQQVFKVSEQVARQLNLIANMLDDLQGEDIRELPVPSVDGHTLALVLEFAQFLEPISSQLQSPTSSEQKEQSERDLQAFCDRLFKIDIDRMLYVLIAAEYLQFDQLQNMGTKKVALLIRGKNADEIRQLFRIKNDFTKEEYFQTQQENNWAFD